MNQLSTFLKTEFDLDLKSASLLQDGCDNTVYKVETTDNQPYVLRISKRENKHSDMAFELAFISFLHAHNLPVPRVISNKHNQSVCCFNGQPACLFSFCAGTVFHLSPTNKPSVQMAMNGGEALANLHKIASGFDPQHTHKTIRSLFYEMEQLLKQKAFFAKKYIAGDVFLDAVETVLKKVKQLHTNDTIIHNDFRIQNLLFDNDTISAILDFDWACIGTGLKDLGHALVEWSFPDTQTACWGDVFKAFLNGYQKVYPDINLEHLSLWIQFSCLADACTYFLGTINKQEEPRALNSYMYQKYLFFSTHKIEEFL